MIKIKLQKAFETDSLGEIDLIRMMIIPRYQPMRASAVGAAKTLFSAC